MKVHISPVSINDCKSCNGSEVVRYYLVDGSKKTKPCYCIYKDIERKKLDNLEKAIERERIDRLFKEFVGLKI